MADHFPPIFPNFHAQSTVLRVAGFVSGRWYQRLLLLKTIDIEFQVNLYEFRRSECGP
jgi:hypothetical protein